MTSVAMTFGRFQPPTIAHEMMLKKMVKIGAADTIVYISPTIGKNNPLDFSTRYDLLRRIAPPEIIVSEIQHTDVFAAIKWVYELGYSDLHLMIGGDRFEELNKRVPMHNGELYKFNRIKIHNAGDRDDSDGLTGMSASRLREAAKLGDYESFERGLPNKLRSMSRDIYQRVHTGCLTKT